MMHTHQADASRGNHNLAMEIEESVNGVEGPADREFLSRREVARLFGVSPSTVTRWARTGLLQTVRTPGGHYRYLAGEARRAVFNVPKPD